MKQTSHACALDYSPDRHSLVCADGSHSHPLNVLRPAAESLRLFHARGVLVGQAREDAEAAAAFEETAHGG